MEPKIYDKKLSILVAFWTTLFIIIVGVCLLLNSFLHWFDHSPIWNRWLLIVLGIPLSLMYLSLSASHLLRKQPVLTIDSDGINANTLHGWGHIPWSEIASTQLQKYSMGLFHHTFLVIILRDKEKMVKRLPAWERLLVPLTSASLHSPIFISTDMVNVPLSDVQLEIENHMYERRKQYEANSIASLPDVPVSEPLRIANR